MPGNERKFRLCHVLPSVAAVALITSSGETAIQRYVLLSVVPGAPAKLVFAQAAGVAVTWVLVFPKPAILERNKNKHLSCTVLVQPLMMVFTFLPAI